MESPWEKGKAAGAVARKPGGLGLDHAQVRLGLGGGAGWCWTAVERGGAGGNWKMGSPLEKGKATGAGAREPGGLGLGGGAYRRWPAVERGGGGQELWRRSGGPRRSWRQTRNPEEVGAGSEDLGAAGLGAEDTKLQSLMVLALITPRCVLALVGEPTGAGRL